MCGMQNVNLGHNPGDLSVQFWSQNSAKMTTSFYQFREKNIVTYKTQNIPVYLKSYNVHKIVIYQW